MKNSIYRIALLLVLAICSTLVTKAQDDDPGDGPAGPPDNPTVPFDGGVSLLIAAGVAYGAKKGYEVQKKKAGNH